MSTDTTKQIRTSSEDRDRYENLKKQMGAPSDAVALNILMRTYEAYNGSKSYPNHTESIESFEESVRVIHNLFMTQIGLIEEQKNIAETNVKLLLESRDKTIQDLQEKNNSLLNKVEKAKEMAGIIQEQKKRLKSADKRIEALEKELENNKTTSRNAELAKTLQDMITKQEENMKSIKKDEN